MREIVVTRSKTDKDRYLILRGNRYVYKRRIPKSVIDFDERAPVVQISLKTSDIAIARAKRDLLEEADNVYWSEFLLQNDSDKAKQRYQAALKRVEALGFSYQSSFDIAKLPLEDIADRLQIAIEQQKSPQIVDSILGGVPKPTVTISAAEKIYFDEITPSELLGKSSTQKKHWLNERLASLKNLKTHIGDKNITDVDRQDALAFYRYLNEFVVAKKRSASWGNKELGKIRIFFAKYLSYIGQQDPVNPFSGLSFRDLKPSRPPFSINWIKSQILVPGALKGINREARHILLTLIDTGARMGEICNLRAENIHLDSDYPFIEIKPSLDPDNPREIKTSSSIRRVPLIGLALAVMKKHPEGFLRYRNKETSLSNTLNKYFRDHDLFETENHVIYSFRHSFEDRLKDANIDSELRRAFMGHTINRPKYGSGGSMQWQWEQLKKIEIPFDPKIID